MMNCCLMHLLRAALLLSLVLPPAASGEDTRTRAGLQALYDFASGSGDRVRDRSGTGKPLDLKIADTGAVEWLENGLRITRPTRIRSSGPAHKLNESIRRSSGITVEAWITPANLEQEGPARIVSLSRNSTERNFTLGQEADRYDFRLRTLGTSNNGVPSTRSSEDSLALKPTHVVYTRSSSGKAVLYLDGRPDSEEAIEGTTYNWHGQFPLSLANEINAQRPWLGTLHLVAIYSRTLLPTEIAAHFRAGPRAPTPPPDTGPVLTGNEILFNRKIAPLLVNHCLECHDTATRKGDLDLSRRESAFAGGSGGEVIVPGQPAESYLVESVRTGEMPRKREPLAETDIGLLEEWIAGGAGWPIEVLDPATFAHGGEVGENWIRRLTLPEYIASVKAAVGIDISSRARELLPPDLRADGFSNTAYNLHVDLDHVSAYARLAERIVEQMDIDAFARRFTRKRTLTDDHMRGLIRDMGQWILRGPLEEEEVVLYRGVSTTVASFGGDFGEAVAMILEAMLQSPRFLYRMENQRGDGTLWPVSEFELASRMSYVIWGAPPDQALMEAAGSGELFTKSGLQARIDRMLEDPRAIARSREFLADWLDLDRLDNLRPDPEHFPHWTPELARDMKRETLDVFEDIVWSGRRPLSALFNADFTWASPRLATHYGLDPIEGESWARYDLAGVEGRGGLLTHGSVLTIGGDEASMVTRGLFVLHNVLRGVIKDPPPCVNTTPVPSSPGKTLRTIAEERIANAQCGGCHSKFEPLAFGLEKFDGLGSWHEKDEHGNLLREDGEVLFPGSAEPVAYGSSGELMDLFANSDRSRRSLTWKLAQFATGRPLVYDDASVVESIHDQADKEGATYQSLIAAIIHSDLVQLTRTEP